MQEIFDCIVPNKKFVSIYLLQNSKLMSRNTFGGSGITAVNRGEAASGAGGDRERKF